MRFCGACGGLLEAPPAAVDPQRRHVTVMFCDLVESTPIAGALDPEDYRDILSAYQQVCSTAIERYDGYTAQYLGDGLLAYFGYPRAHEDNAVRAVNAGLEILDEIAGLSERFHDRHGIALQVRIGVHTGVVVAGEMGAGETRDPRAIVGETPHIAARLQSIAQPGSLVISAATHELLEGYFEAQFLGDQQLKGVSRAVRAHRVLRSSGAASRFERAGARRVPLVNRHYEMARLTEAWQQACSGQGRLVVLRGEAGIGKSRLTFELRQRLGLRIGGAQVWQCSAHRRSTALYPVIRFLARWLAIDASQPAEERLAVLDRAAVEAGLDPERSVPVLADLLSVPSLGPSAGPGLAGRELRAATFQLIESLLITRAAHHPLLLVVEDLHWADPTTVELLERIIASLAALPVLCILTCRPEFETTWTNRRPDVEIELGPLASTEVRELAISAGGAALDDELLDRVDAAADGVPLFVEEMLKMVELEGRAASASAVPATLQGLLTERLDRLPELGEVIDAAAILGREFDRQLLEALTPLTPEGLEAALAKLAEQDLMRPIEGGARCEFKHALLQEVAYERMLRTRRRLLHGRVAEVLTRGEGARAPRPEVVAHHFSAAGEPGKAVGHWREAGIRALERAAFLEAAEHFRRGLEALDERAPDGGEAPERVDFLTYRAAALQAGRGYAAPGVEEAYSEARRGCELARSQDRLVAVIRGEWLYYLLRSDYGTALDLANDMLIFGERSGDPTQLAEGHLFCGFPEMYLGKFDLARADFSEALAHYRRPEHADQIYEAQGDTGVMALAYLALVLWNLGHAAQSRERSDRSLELVEQVGGPVTRALAWGMRSILHLSRSETAELRFWVERSVALCREYNIGYWQTVASVLSAWIQGRGDDLRAGIARLEESVDAYLSSGSRLSLPHFCIYLADLRMAEGDRPRALDALRMGEEHVEVTGERFAESELFRFKGRVLMSGARPDPEGASAAYERAVSVARAQNARLLELRAATRLSLHRRSLGEADAGIDRLTALCDWFGPDSKLADVVRARELLTREPAAP